MSNNQAVQNRPRLVIAEKMAKYDSAIQAGQSQRCVAEELDIPRSTLQRWLEKRESIDADPTVTAFFESPAGTAILHRLILAAHLVITLMGGNGVRLVCMFLELTGLNRYVANSYGAQQKVCVQMEGAVAEFAMNEKNRLAEGMARKDITVCEDENFHSGTCLVAIEPVSNFILIEKYSDGRKSEDWTKAMDEATKGLPVAIIQSTSDEAKGILHHVKQGLGAHHSPDVFHVQHEIVKGVNGPLANKTRRAEKALEEASAEVNRHIEDKAAYSCEKHGPGRPPEFDKRIEKAREKETESRSLLETAEKHQKEVREAVQGISDDYHPVDIETGKLKTAEEVSKALQQRFSKIEETALEAGLAEPSFNRIKKAKKVVVEMAATIVFFYLAMKAKVEALCLMPEAEWAMINNLIPAIYLRLVSERAKTAELQKQLRQKSEELLNPLKARNGPFSGLEPEELTLIEEVAEECANLFQRSSSCVEGRNGLLSLRHHSLHRISDRKLAALTAVHNYMAKRNDGTTAAERFFGLKPKDLFEYILSHVELPGRPAQKRPQEREDKYLKMAA